MPASLLQEVKLEDLPRLVQDLYSDASFKQLKATQLFRKLLLGSNQDPPISEVIKAGIVPRLVEFLSYEHHSLLQVEAAGVLANIAAGTAAHTQAVVSANTIPNCVRLLSSDTRELRDQAAGALGNIAVESASFRDEVLKAEALPPLLHILQQTQAHTHADLHSLRTATWLLSNLCAATADNCYPDVSLVSPAIPTLSNLLQECGDLEILADASRAISNLRHDQSKELLVEQEGLVKKLVVLSTSGIPPQSHLKTIWGLLAGSAEWKQIAIACLEKLATHECAEVARLASDIRAKHFGTDSGPVELLATDVETRMVIDSEAALKDIPSYIAAINTGDSSEQIRGTRSLRTLLSVEDDPPIAAIAESGVIPRVVEFLSHDNHQDLQYEAACALTIHRMLRTLCIFSHS